jgi:4-amino-4-deoxy-L-arabinose transferase-like glycosyltransferase
MRPLPVQLWDAEAPPEWVVVYGQATDVLSALLGLFIAYQAYRGYRRHDSRPMLYIAAGFLLALAVPFLLLVGYLVVPGLPETAVSLATETSQVLGLVAILYALWMPE